MLATLSSRNSRPWPLTYIRGIGHDMSVLFPALHWFSYIRMKFVCIQLLVWLICVSFCQVLYCVGVLWRKWPGLLPEAKQADVRERGTLHCHADCQRSALPQRNQTPHHPLWPQTWWVPCLIDFFDESCIKWSESSIFHNSLFSI